MKAYYKLPKIVRQLFLTTPFFLLILTTQNCSALEQQATSNQQIASNTPSSKKIALTFDDGPNKNYTKQVLDILKQNNVKATFFVCGNSTIANPNLVREEFNDGHEIASHSYSHPNLTKLDEAGIAEELTKANNAIYKAIQRYPTIFRPPYGASSSTVNKVAAGLGIKKVTWDYLINDYETRKVTPEIISSSIIQHAHPNAIIVMHDGGGNRDKTVAALPAMIAALREQGYTFVSVAEILNIEPYKEF